MSLFVLSDLHLSLGIDKPMDVFGTLWHDYMNRISENWKNLVTDDDLVIIGGDISWATYLDEAKPDFEFLNSLPGKKLIIKGNHDYWWESITKLNNFMAANSFDTIEFLHNTFCLYKNFLISGTRFWTMPGSDGFNSDDQKIYDREISRLCLSLEAAQTFENKNPQTKYQKIVCLHYPPVLQNGTADENVLSLLKKYGVKICLYGHLHGGGLKGAFDGNISGIDFKLTSSDYLGFSPLKLT